ncbi:MAG TPA: hypothetical protein PKA84_16835, partial [Rubrivivax sp.]|nr:hypothetical protein [Rubrivivax sp.]
MLASLVGRLHAAGLGGPRPKARSLHDQRPRQRAGNANDGTVVGAAASLHARRAWQARCSRWGRRCEIGRSVQAARPLAGGLRR